MNCDLKSLDVSNFILALLPCDVELFMHLCSDFLLRCFFVHDCSISSIILVIILVLVDILFLTAVFTYINPVSQIY